MVGFDGASPNILEPWVREGKLPIFEKIMKNGVYGKLNSTIPNTTVPAWPSFYTGKNPGGTGIFYFEEVQEGKDANIVTMDSVKSACIWDYFDLNKIKSFIMGIPVTYPPPKTNGIMVSGPLSPGEEFEYTHPKNFKKELRNYKIAADRYLETNKKTWGKEFHKI